MQCNHQKHQHIWDWTDAMRVTGKAGLMFIPLTTPISFTPFSYIPQLHLATFSNLTQSQTGRKSCRKAPIDPPGSSSMLGAPPDLWASSTQIQNHLHGDGENDARGMGDVGLRVPRKPSGPDFMGNIWGNYPKKWGDSMILYLFPYSIPWGFHPPSRGDTQKLVLGVCSMVVFISLISPCFMPWLIIRKFGSSLGSFPSSCGAKEPRRKKKLTRWGPTKCNANGLETTQKCQVHSTISARHALIPMQKFQCGLHPPVFHGTWTMQLTAARLLMAAVECGIINHEHPGWWAAPTGEPLVKI